ncbi:BLOC-1 related complex subunit 6 [Pristis pectinata]|uniref:BLOC-1 related complex subunit 6 n=1 Tax=Pristis pectinata TaxID=685728 RepID=UPI00223C9E9A|nr:BLOC-1 related complex subunit 6 [Pristis pectinata]
MERPQNKKEVGPALSPLTPAFRRRPRLCRPGAAARFRTSPALQAVAGGVLSLPFLHGAGVVGERGGGLREQKSTPRFSAHKQNGGAGFSPRRLRRLLRRAVTAPPRPVRVRSEDGTARLCASCGGPAGEGGSGLTRAMAEAEALSPPSESGEESWESGGESPECAERAVAATASRDQPAVSPAARERVCGRLQDSKSLDGISQVLGGVRGRDGKLEGRRATISSALELEGTVSHDGDLTHYVANNLQHKIKMSSRQSLDLEPGSSVKTKSMQRLKSDIPPIDPGVLQDLERDAKEVAQKVDQMMRGLNATIQNMTALSVGYIQTYRDSVDSLGESVDMSIKGMYTLMARCEELDRSMQPILVLSKQIREVKRTLEMFETLCK